MDLNEISIFTKVVEVGSFTKAAAQLGMPLSTVSAKVADLEKRLGASLIQRTTRKLFITDEGRRFYERCMKGLEELRCAEEEIAIGQNEPQGLLRLTAPVELGSTVLPKVIEQVRRKFPKVSFDLHLTDRTVDLIAEGFDLAIRAGQLKDSSLIAKKLGEVYFAPFASTSYLKKNPVLKIPQDLTSHQCLQFVPMGKESWKLSNGKSTVTVPMKKRIVINELNTVKALAIDGMGVALLPTFLCLNDVKVGKLVRVLPDWRSNLSPVHFVYAGQRHSTPKVNMFIEVAGDIIKENLQVYSL